ncbi:MAG: hypothetical protein KF770_22915 [Anaerolineae bacterium]|nr:hypothetical protein [Anaerolineae bacterium]
MVIIRLFGKLLKAMFDLCCIALMLIGATAWVSMKFLARYAYEILFVLLLLRFLVFILFLFIVLFGFKRR